MNATNIDWVIAAVFLGFLMMGGGICARFIKMWRTGQWVDGKCVFFSGLGQALWRRWLYGQYLYELFPRKHADGKLPGDDKGRPRTHGYIIIANCILKFWN